jgi:hypothetical protein
MNRIAESHGKACRAICAGIVLLGIASSLDARTFRDIEGRKLEGELVGLSGDQVTIRVAGKQFVLPITKFSPDDQRFIQHSIAVKGELTVYPPLPDNQYGSNLYEVSVSQAGKGQPSYVYQSSRENTDGIFTTDANHWTSFSFSGSVTVQIKLRNGASIQTATVRPLAKQVRATVANNTVSLTLTDPANLFVELDSQPRHPLFIFANPPEVNVPAKATPNVIYFGPGVTDLGTKPLVVTDGQTIYLTGGAYVKGRLDAVTKKGGPGVTIRGRGILSGIGITEKRGTFSQFMISARDLALEGIVVTDSPGPCCFCGGRLTAENVKLLAWTRCSDGIGGGPESLVKHCFLKVNDDNIHFHSTGMQAIDNVVWLQAAGSALQMGWNVTKSVEGEHADGLDIIGNDLGRTGTKLDWVNGNAVALMDIHNRAAYRNVVIENVRYESKPYQLFGIRTKLAPENPASLASYREGLGCVEGIVIRNITTELKPLHPSVFEGNGDEPGTISNVTFENVRIAGTSMTETNSSDYVIRRGKTSGFRYVPAVKQVAPQPQSPGKRK